MKNSSKICSAAFKNEMLLLIKSGISQSDIENEVGISLDQLSDPDEMISMKYYVALEKSAPVLAKNPGIFIELGTAKTGTSQTGILGHVASSGETVRTCFHQAVRFSCLLSDASRIELREEGDLARFVFMRESPEFFTTQSVELAFSRTQTLMKSLWGRDFEPFEINFQYSAPDHVRLYRKVFKNIYFNQAENCILFPGKLLDRKNPFYQPYVGEILLKHAEKILEKRMAKETLEQQTSTIILKHLPKGTVSADQVASELHMSRQTLFRKLKAETGLSFRELLKTTRKELAGKFVADNQFLLTEIAYLLGFSESSAFNRAFKSWYHSSPGEYRRRIRRI